MLYVCSLSAVPALASETGASHLLTVISSGTPVERPASIPASNHLYLEFNDITAPAEGLVPPGMADVEKIIEFGRSWDQAAPMIVHCWAGVSRSTAAGFVLSHVLSENKDPYALALLLRKRAPWATPNSRIIALADRLLGANGTLKQAISDIGRGQNAFEGRPFALPVGDAD
ncbi:MAG: tyrosine protein phosphatase [Pseudomonadota bacterium]